MRKLLSKIDFNAPVTLGLTILCAAILLGSKFIVPLLMAVPGFNFILYPLVHADFAHLFGNLTFILLLGPLIEEKYGSKITLFMVLLTTLLTGLINVFLFGNVIIGASGIVFMLIMLASLTNIKNKKIPLTFILIFLLYIGQEVIAGFSPDNISHFGHIMGGICGSVFGLVYNWKVNKE